jgi:amidophosphoribosyltransferase
MQICAFLWVYYGYPPSYYEGINVDECRYRCGAALARRDNVNVDFVCGIPDSGVGHAIGYGNEKGIPYKRAYSKYTPTWPRSFMPQNQVQRDLVAKMKLIPNRAIIEGKKMVFLDDSIVRGTQLKDNTIDLLNAGGFGSSYEDSCPPSFFHANSLISLSQELLWNLPAEKQFSRLKEKMPTLPSIQIPTLRGIWIW